MKSEFKALPLDVYSMAKSPEASTRQQVTYEMVFELNGKGGFTLLTLPREFEKDMDKFMKNLSK